MEDLTRVILLGGLGPLRFGDSPERAITILGQPTCQGPNRFSTEQWLLQYNSWFCPVGDESVGGPRFEGEPVPRARLVARFPYDGESQGGLNSLETDSQAVRIASMEICGASEVTVVSRLREAGLAFKGYVPVSHEDWLVFSHGLMLFSYDGIITRMQWDADQNEAERVGTFG